MTEEALNTVFANAYMFGIGIMKVVNTPRGLEMSVVGHEEYLKLSEALKFVAENTVEIKDGEQPKLIKP
jgi:hypothetical protein